MKVALIYPLLSKKRSRVDENKQFWPPLGIGYIAAYIEQKGHSVKIIDRDVLLRKNRLDFNKADEMMLSQLKEFEPDIVGFSATTPNISDVNYVSGMVKKIFPRCTTIIGGPHCIGEPILTLKICCSIDILVRGEGEVTMLEIAEGLELKRILGITYRADGDIVSNPDRPPIKNLDDLPMPARHLLDMAYYTRPSRFIGRNLAMRTTHVFTARGCPYRCNYCAGPIIGFGMVRFHSPERVISEIEMLIKKYNIEAIYFAEDMFLSDRRRSYRIFELLKERKINRKIVWMAQLNSKVATEGFLRSMKDAGCVHVEYGFESGSQRMLGLMNKNNDVNENMEVANLTRKMGLRFQANFIVGYPGETADDFNKTIDFIKKAKPSHTAVNIFMPLPGTAIYNRLKSENRPIPNWDDFGDPDAPQVNYADVSKNEFERLYFKARLKVVLPMNLFSFVKDNIRHPLRLLLISLTQFKGIFIKILRSIVRLSILNRVAVNR